MQPHRPGGGNDAGNVNRVAAVQGALARVEFRRSVRARKISLRIDPAQGGVVITLPPRASRRAGLSLLQTHEAWVAEKLAELPGAIPFVAGAVIPIHGLPHVIVPAGSRPGGAWIEDGQIFVSGGAEFLSRRVTDHLRRLARQHLTALAAEKAKQAGGDAEIRAGKGHQDPLGAAARPTVRWPFAGG